MRILVAIVVLVGCETGTEIASVSRATVERTPSGGAIVTATLDCVVATGMPRGDGNCDADNTRVCVNASWSRASVTKPLAETQVCRTVPQIRGATVLLPLSKVPTDAETVLVLTTDQHRARDEPLRRGVTVR